MTRMTWIVGAVAALALSGCGGSDGGYDNTIIDPTKVPASALSSPQSYTQFVGSLATTDSGEGLSLEGVTPPVTDTEEPLKLT